jgi:hypothetical protein
MDQSGIQSVEWWQSVASIATINLPVACRFVRSDRERDYGDREYGSRARGDRGDREAGDYDRSERKRERGWDRDSRESRGYGERDRDAERRRRVMGPSMTELTPEQQKQLEALQQAELQRQLQRQQVGSESCGHARAPSNGVTSGCGPIQ